MIEATHQNSSESQYILICPGAKKQRDWNSLTEIQLAGKGTSDIRHTTYDFDSIRFDSIRFIQSIEREEKKRKQREEKRREESDIT